MCCMRPVWRSVSTSKSSSSVPNPPGKTTRAIARKQEMELADGEVVELEAEVRA